MSVFAFHTYRQISNISRVLIDNKIVDIVVASPDG